MPKWIVIENTPGYLPDDDDPFVTDDYSDAVDYADDLADDLDDQGYECDRAAGDGYYVISCFRTDTVAPDLGRQISVVPYEDGDDA